jgi:hypothetical protein
MTEPNQGTRKAGCMLRSNGRREQWAIEGSLLGVLMVPDFPVDPRDLACRGLFEPVGQLYGAQRRSSAHVAPDPGRDSIRSGFGAFGQVRVAYSGRREPKAAHFRSGHARSRCAFGLGRPLSARCQESTQPNRRVFRGPDISHAWRRRRQELALPVYAVEALGRYAWWRGQIVLMHGP